MFDNFKKTVKSAVSQVLSSSEEEKKAISDDVTSGSTPHISYYVLMSIASLIAGFGLVADSPAVIIGAMLVSPLMTPIFGISLGLVRGDINILRKSLQAEVGGVVLAIGIATIFGLLPLSLDITPEMLARTSPTLLDLLVAALAGFAGCLAMIDKRISPVLPGVAIAISLVPPLATCGLCLSLGAYSGAYGAFLLFFANFIAILLVASTIFIIAGFATREQIGQKWDFIKRFSPAFIALLIVFIILSHALITITKGRQTTKELNRIFAEELQAEPATSVERVIHKFEREKLDVLAILRTPQVLSPDKVKQMQDRIKKRLNINTNLIVRCGLAKDISSTGSTSVIADKNLDGSFISSKLHPNVEIAQMAEQVIREQLSEHPNLLVEDIHLIQFTGSEVVLANLQGSRPLTPVEVRSIELKIQERLKNNSLRLLARCNRLIDVSSKGRVLYGQAHFGKISAKELQIQKKIEGATKNSISRIPGMFPSSVDAACKDGNWFVRAEVFGQRVMTPSEVNTIEKTISRTVLQEVTLSIWSKAELMVTKEDYSPVDNTK